MKAVPDKDGSASATSTYMSPLVPSLARVSAPLKTCPALGQVGLAFLATVRVPLQVQLGFLSVPKYSCLSSQP